MSDDASPKRFAGRPPRGGGRPVRVPDELAHALHEAPGAAERWELLAAAHRREWADWVRDGRRTDTRERRAAQAVMRLLHERSRASDDADEDADDEAAADPGDDSR